MIVKMQVALVALVLFGGFMSFIGFRNENRKIEGYRKW